MEIIQILVTDEKSPGYELNHLYFRNINDWAQAYCSSYIGFDIQDVSDVSYHWDEIACYSFTDDHDATLFRLKWL